MPNTTRKLPRNRLRNNRTKGVYTRGSNNSLISPGAALRGGTCVVNAEENSFNHPTQVEQWFYGPDEEQNKKNRYNFIFGLGVILKYKEELMEGKVKSIVKDLEKNNDEYAMNELNYEKLMGEAQQRSTSDMKEKLQETVRENLNKAYENKFSELLVKKQSYDVVLECVRNRRWYLVAALQKDGGDSGIFRKIVDAAKEIYSFYRGPKYVQILGDLYNMIKIISKVPSSLQESFALNTSIVGPAGSGKTTMARQIAKWYAYLGIMTYDAFFEDPEKLAFSETGRSGLIGEYTGQTAPKTLGVMVKSLEKTLFIDEAYSVAGCAFDKDDKLEPDPYGEEFLATMLTFMNDHKGFSALIVAGYENFMRKCFFDRNEGLPRRFPRSITLPFYATDELFGIFMRNVIKKCLDGIYEAKKAKNNELKAVENARFMAQKAVETETDDVLKGRANDNLRALTEKKATVNAERVALLTKYNNISYYHFRYLTVMKPSFMMIHGDTSFHAVDILRKYLLSIQSRLQLTSGSKGMTNIQNLDDGKAPIASSASSASELRLENIYSYSILAQVLINLFDADSKSARKHIFRRLFYSKVFNFEKANMSFFPAQAGEMDNLADECVRSLGAEISATMNVDGQVVVGVCKETEVINAYCSSKKLKVQLFKQLADTNKYYMELHNTNIDMIDVQDRISRFFELDRLFNDCVPSLTELYQLLGNADSMTTLTKHVMGLYLKKIDNEYLEALNESGEKDFPIHMTKATLETEIEALRNILSYKPNKEFFEKQELAKNADSLNAQIIKVEELVTDEKFKQLKADASKDEQKLVDDLVAVNLSKVAGAQSLANPMLKALFAGGLSKTAQQIMKSDIMYEDFGYSDKINRDDEIYGGALKNTQVDKTFSIQFLSGLDDRIFGSRVTTDLDNLAVVCTVKQLAESVAKSETNFLVAARAKKNAGIYNPRLERVKEEERAKATVRLPDNRAAAPQLPV